MPESTPAPTRAHAVRNREKLIAVARSAFASPDASTSLEAIARQAGVGIGTLYRHFPTREALVVTVYAAELDDITAAVATLLDELTPRDALRAWLGRYATFATTKRGMIDTLRGSSAAGSFGPLTRERLTTAIRAILERGAQTGTLRADVDADDIASLLHGVFHGIADGDTAGRTGRLLDLIVDALSVRAS
ncbi:TetR/AcrR family transcriptional regulator [Micromonosporaceae bacterium Da 78-11]